MSTEILINRYKVLDRLGEGAMGAVWLVEDSTSQDTLAMKVLSQALEGSEKSFLQLKQEFRLMTQLRHPNCCAVYDYGQLPDGSPYLTMEVVPGRGLDEMLPVANPDELKGILSQLCLALGYVHQLGYVHSDLKSQNVRVRPDGVVKLMDYGLMELSGRSNAPIKGTLAYMAPEVVKRGKIDQRADLYALGCLAYELVCGQPPFVSANMMDVLRAHVNEAPMPLSRRASGVDKDLERLVMKLLAKDPYERYQSAYEVMADLGVEVPSGIGGNLLSSPMIGREEPLSSLEGKLTGLAKWQPGGTVLLTGGAGMGKSRMVEEFRYLVQVENLAFAAGRPVERGATPYGPIVQVMRRLLPALKAQVPDALAERASVLVKLLPELLGSDGFPDLVPAPDLDPPVREKLRLQATVAELLFALATAQPLVLALEDWQWVDPLSAELLTYMLRNVKDASLLFLITSRNVPDDVGAWGERLQHVPLVGLDPRSMWRMVTSMLGADAVGTRFMSQVADFSGGSPFLIERLLEHLVRERYLVAERGRWNTQIELTPEQLPNDLASMLAAKIDDLTPVARQVARAAAVIEQGISLELLAHATKLDDDVLFDAVAELQAATVLEETEDGGYRFGQAQLAELLKDSLTLTEKTALHASMVTGLEQRVGDLPLSELSFETVRRLAHHSLLGNVPEKTIVYALEAGVRCVGLNAMSEAERFLSDGLALVRLEAGGRWKSRLLDYLRFLADTYRITSKHQPAIELLREAIPLGEELEANLVVGRMLTSLAKSCQIQAQYTEAIENGERSAVIAASLGDRTGEARALMTVGRVHFFQGRLAEALGYADRAAAAGRESGDPSILAAAFAMGGYFAVASGEPDKLEQGVSDLRESLSLLETSRDKLGLINSLSFMGNAQVMLGDFVDALATFQNMKAQAFEAGSKDDEIVALVNLATTTLELGKVAASVGHAREARELVDKRGSSKYAKGLAVGVEALAQLYLGQASGAGARAQEAVDFVREIKNKYVEALTLPYQLEVLLQLGRLKEARGIGEALSALIQETGNTEPEGRLNVLMAEVFAREGDLMGARSLAQRAEDGAIKAQSKGLQVRAARTLAWIELLAGNWDECRRRADAALALAERIGARVQAQEINGLLGALTLAVGGSRHEATSRYQAMTTLARETEVQLALPTALFGQAAADPCRDVASQLVEEAQAVLGELVAGMDEDGARAFQSTTERKLVLRGDRHRASLPTRLPNRHLALLLRLRTFYRGYALN